MLFKRKPELFPMRDSDRTAIAFIIICIVSGSLVSVFLRDDDGNTKDNRRNSSAITRRKEGNRSYAQPDMGYGDGNIAADNGGNAELFPFDPNTADSTMLLRLGLKPWQVRNIYRYRAHGGRYNTREDFARLYGLTLSHYRRLEPYIHIKREIMAADVIKRRSDAGEKKVQTVVERNAMRREYQCKLTLSDPKVDINKADTALLKRIPGIGSYYAGRIIELRRRRQAFVSPEELLCIRNFPEHSLAYMTASHDFPLIAVNTMTHKELHAHPLLNYTQASDIVSLRRTAGRITSLEDLRFLKSFTSEQLSRLEPFVRFE